MSHSGSTIGMVGLGAMGTAYTRRLLDGGIQVLGYDIAETAINRHRAAGGLVANSTKEVAERCDIILTSLPGFDAFDSVNSIVAEQPRPKGYLIDTNTMSKAKKEDARKLLAGAGWTMLDCTVSGNPSMVLNGSCSFFVSGAQEADPRILDTVRCIASKIFDLGDFGNAALIKLIINHLCMIHNTAAAEAMSLGAKAGIDREVIYNLVTASGGSSRMFEARGRAMAMGDYSAIAGEYNLWLEKDGVVIGELARELRHPVPMFAAAYQAHMIGLAQGWGERETSSMCAVFETLSGQRTSGPTPSDA